MLLFRVNLCYLELVRSSPPEVFSGKGVLKICSKFTGEHPCRSVISIKLQSNFIEITLHHGRSPSCKLAAYFQNTFSKNSSGGLLLTHVLFIVGLILSRSCLIYSWQQTTPGESLMMFYWRHKAVDNAA